MWSAVELLMDSLKTNRQTGAVPESIRKSRCQSRIRPENGEEGTIQNLSAWLPNGAGRGVGFLAQGVTSIKHPAVLV